MNLSPNTPYSFPRSRPQRSPPRLVLASRRQTADIKAREKVSSRPYRGVSTRLCGDVTLSPEEFRWLQRRAWVSCIFLAAGSRLFSRLAASGGGGTEGSAAMLCSPFTKQAPKRTVCISWRRFGCVRE